MSEFWKVPRMWEGGECWIIGGGQSAPYQFDVPENIIRQVTNNELPPSAYSPYFSPIHGKHVIGVNMAYLLGHWIDIIMFGDSGFYLKNRSGLAQFPGIKVTCNTNMGPNASKGKLKTDNSIKLLQQIGSKGISKNPQSVCWNGNTGGAAINLAIHTGVKKIILVGFDMRLINDQQHWHQLYGKREINEHRLRKLPFDRHLRCFLPIAKAAKRLGVEIINASPDSAIEEFRKLTVKQSLT